MRVTFTLDIDPALIDPAHIQAVADGTSAGEYVKGLTELATDLGREALMNDEPARVTVEWDPAWAAEQHRRYA